MIGGFFAKPVGGAKFCLFCNSITNISHDKYGPVDMDKLMTIQNEKMLKSFDLVLKGSIADSYEKDEHNFNKEKIQLN